MTLEDHGRTKGIGESGEEFWELSHRAGGGVNFARLQPFLNDGSLGEAQPYCKG